MADEAALTQEQVAEMRKKRTFRKFTFRGVDLDKLLDLSMEVCVGVRVCRLEQKQHLPGYGTWYTYIIPAKSGMFIGARMI